MGFQIAVSVMQVSKDDVPFNSEVLLWIRWNFEISDGEENTETEAATKIRTNSRYYRVRKSLKNGVSFGFLTGSRTLHCLSIRKSKILARISL